MGAFYHNQTDSLPPAIMITSPSSGDTLSTSHIFSLTWEASDIRSLSWIKLFYSIDNGNNYYLIDSTDAVVGFYDWLVPNNSISNQCKLKASVADHGSNTTDNTTNYTFVIIDGTPPEISVHTPTSDFRVPEFEEVTTSWLATDNGDLDSVYIEYSNDGGSYFQQVGSIHSDSSSYYFNVTEGVSDSALVKIIVTDSRGNIGEGYSEFFTITDNTPPTVSINTPSNVFIGDTVNVQWTAHDNTEIQSHLLYYTIDGFQTVISIDSVGGSADNSIWIAPNAVIAQAYLIITTYDTVGLSDSDTSNSFEINDGIPPEISVVAPISGYTIPEYHEITVVWEAYDNIGLDSIWIYYSNSNPSFFSLISGMEADTNRFTYVIPQGLTNTAQIKLTVRDLAGNENSFNN